MRFLPQSADRCRDLWLRPADSTRRWNQTGDLRNLRAASEYSNAPLETVSQLASSAEGDLGTVQLIRSTGDQRSQLRQACSAGNTGVITVFWSGWERGASSSSLLRSGGRRQRCQRPRLRSPLSLGFVRRGLDQPGERKFDFSPFDSTETIILNRQYWSVEKYK